MLTPNAATPPQRSGVGSPPSTRPAGSPAATAARSAANATTSTPTTAETPSSPTLNRCVYAITTANTTPAGQVYARLERHDLVDLADRAALRQADRRLSCRRSVAGPPEAFVVKSRGYSVDFRGPRLTTRPALRFLAVPAGSSGCGRLALASKNALCRFFISPRLPLGPRPQATVPTYQRPLTRTDLCTSLSPSRWRAWPMRSIATNRN